MLRGQGLVLTSAIIFNGDYSCMLQRASEAGRSNLQPLPGDKATSGHLVGACQATHFPAQKQLGYFASCILEEQPAISWPVLQRDISVSRRAVLAPSFSAGEQVQEQPRFSAREQLAC
jgi:hypothetical protein